MRRIGKTQARKIWARLEKHLSDDGKWSCQRIKNGRGDYGLTEIYKNSGKPVFAISLDGARLHTEFYVDDKNVEEVLCSG